MPAVKNEHYKRFLNEGIIEILDKEKFKELLNAVEHPHLDHARALVILLYYTGRRPSEVLELTHKDVKLFKNYIEIMFRTKKDGRGTLIQLPKDEITVELWEFFEKHVAHPDAYIFWMFRSNKVRVVNGREYKDVAAKLWHWVKKWGQKAGMDITPYFFRHNRLSDLAMKGADPYDLMYFKGAKDLKSVMPYLHLSMDRAKKVARLLKK